MKKNAVKQLVEHDYIVITVSGRAGPVVREEIILKSGEAVIDKDHASALVAEGIGGDYLIILIEAERVAVSLGKPD